MTIWRIVGGIGMLLVSIGIFQRHSERARNALFVIGGALLLVYSASERDIIFSVLQVVFTGAALYELLLIKSK